MTRSKIAVLWYLRDGHRSGRELRQALKHIGLPKTGRRFYLMMAVLEEEGYVKGYDVSKVVENVDIKARHYKLTVGR